MSCMSNKIHYFDTKHLSKYKNYNKYLIFLEFIISNLFNKMIQMNRTEIINKLTREKEKPFDQVMF